MQKSESQYCKIWINMFRKVHPLYVVEQCPCPIPRSTTESDEAALQSSTLCSEHGGCGVADSLGMGSSGFEGATWALVSLSGMLLTVHLISNPKVTSHLEVETALRAGVALWVAEAFVCDANDLCAVERATEWSDLPYFQCKSIQEQQQSAQINTVWCDKDKQQQTHVMLIRTETLCFLINTDNIKTEVANVCRWGRFDKEKLTDLEKNKIAAH